MKFFKSPLFVAALTVFLGVFFVSIVFLQSKKEPNVETNTTSKNTPSAKTTVSETTTETPSSAIFNTVSASNSETQAEPETKTTKEKKQVLVSFFDDDNKEISKKEVPLYEITKVEKGNQPAQIVGITADGDLAKSLIDEIKLPNEKPSSAKVIKTDSMFDKIVGNDSGLEVDKKKTLAALEQSIQSNTAANNFQKIDVKVVTKKNEGFSGKMNEMGFKTLLAKFRTNHPGHVDDDARNVNLAIASQKINGLIIPPNGKFSFNKVVGERSKKNGFKEAGVISQGRVIPGLGGGICQVSTTLYRAVLLSGAKINERHNHSIYDGIEYAQRGLDAAVAWGYKDFKFTNGLNEPILITSTSGKGWVEVSIYAENKPFESIELYTRNEVKKPFKTEKRINNKLKSGEVKIVHPGVDGYTVEAYRTITLADGKTKEERLSKDNYLTFNRIEERNN